MEESVVEDTTEHKPESQYQSYVLRLWVVREKDGESDHENDRWVCRASLQPIPDLDGSRRGFANLSALFAFLEEQIERQTRPPHSPAPSGNDD